MSLDLPKSIEWIGGLDGQVALIDQTRLPGELVIIECRDAESIWEAIKSLRVRGAPAIGIAAAMGLVLGVRNAADDENDFFSRLSAVSEYLAGSRPTAVNLTWALNRMNNRARELRGQSVETLKRALLDEARRIRDQDAAMCRAIGRAGLPLIKPGMTVMTHCNAGALATAEYGTALAPLYLAHERGVPFRVLANETRPLLQGARLTAWELARVGIAVTLVCDSAAGRLMQAGKVDLVITGADRIAANGDVANKIGTYSLAVIAAAHYVPFYVAAPTSTIDPETPAGDQIPIEERDSDEIRRGFGRLTAPEGVPCLNPAFDVTPARLIRGLICERGLIEPLDITELCKILQIRDDCPDG